MQNITRAKHSITLKLCKYHLFETFRASCVDDKASELIAVTCSAPYLVTAQWERT